MTTSANAGARGVRLTAQVLWLVCAAAALQARPAAAGYLDPAVALHIEAWLPGAPADDSMAKAADVETYFRTRSLIGTARAEEAHADDVPPAEPLRVAPRFTYLLGITLSPANAPNFLHPSRRTSAAAAATARSSSIRNCRAARSPSQASPSPARTLPATRRSAGCGGRCSRRSRRSTPTRCWRAVLPSATAAWCAASITLPTWSQAGWRPRRCSRVCTRTRRS
jgi:hypothetical protein